MRILTLDAHDWTSVMDFYDSLLQEIGAPDWHGRSIDALIDTMIYGDGEINAVSSPYTVRVVSSALAPQDVRVEISRLQRALTTAPLHCRADGVETVVRVELVD